jgi:hypothetical protein
MRANGEQDHLAHMQFVLPIGVYDKLVWGLGKLTQPLELSVPCEACTFHLEGTCILRHM